MDVSPVVPAASTPALPSANPLVAWLLGEGWSIREPKDLVLRLGQKMVALGLPVWRLGVTIRTLHPQYLGSTFTWRHDRPEVEEFLPTPEILRTERYLASPYAAIFEGAGGVRRRLEGPNPPLDFPILADLKADGATDYAAWPLTFADGAINAVTLAADRPGGFTVADLATIDEALPVLARLMECHALRSTARTILDTYLGRHSGRRVLEGRIRRGDGEDIHAVIWFSDLRGSTALADRMPRSVFLALLNDYFECMAGAVLDHGGEVLRFIGDAALAIFPIGAVVERPERCAQHVRACNTAIDAAADAAGRVAAVNAVRAAAGAPQIGFGIGLHLGDVLYGNIGVPARLEFTVIGAAANEAARIEALCKAVGRPVLISEAVARVARRPLISLGFHALRGVARPQELFTLPDTAGAVAVTAAPAAP